MHCEYCGKEYQNSNSLLNHSSRCPENPNRVLHLQDYSKRTPANQHTKGTAKPWTDEQRVIAREKSLRYWTDENRAEHSALMSKIMPDVVKKHPESYSCNNVCGRAKKFIYNGIMLHSSWELVVARWLDANGIKWIRCSTGFTYTWKGKDKTYFPDFYLPDNDLYLEVKGYQTERDAAKWSVVSNLLVLKKKEISEIRNNSDVAERLCASFIRS